MPDRRTHSQTLKDRATQLLIKYKSGALVTQFGNFKSVHGNLEADDQRLFEQCEKNCNVGRGWHPYEGQITIKEIFRKCEERKA